MNAGGPIDVTIGKQLRLRRIEVGMSSEDLGAIIGLSSKQISKYERGEHRIYASKLKEISAALTVPISYFFDEIDLQFDYSERESLELLKDYFGITEASARRKIRELTKMLRRDGQ